MPRVKTQKKSTAGRELRCGRCGALIEPGETYYRWSFRYGGPRQNCFRHYPRPSELTQSLIGEIYSAVETAEDAMSEATSIEEIRGLVEEVATAAESVKEQYEQAAEAINGAGPNQERADELEGWVDELQSFEPGEDEENSEEFKEAALREIVAGTGCDPDAISYDDEDAVIAVFMVDEAILDEKIAELREEQGGGEELEEIRSQALELINGCPL